MTGGFGPTGSGDTKDDVGRRGDETLTSVGTERDTGPLSREMGSIETTAALTRAARPEELTLAELTSTIRKLERTDSGVSNEGVSNARSEEAEELRSMTGGFGGIGLGVLSFMEEIENGVGLKGGGKRGVGIGTK